MTTGETPTALAPAPASPPPPPTTLVILVRHGATPTTDRLLPGRAPGLGLSDLGREQAERVAERLTARTIDALYSSPLQRTRETAQPTADCTGLPVVEDAGLIECDVGEWTGRALADLAKLPEWRTVQAEPDAFTFPGGESFVAMQERMVAALARVKEAHLGGTAVCFSHADPIRVALADALGTPLNRFQRISVDPCSVSVISYQDGRDPVVLMVNSSQASLADLTAS
ncbi:phosphoglycerate mutase [Tersicoccus phoenicis]|uniref:Phosphoglycerate mutase n=1 Tax=Tersicoccus phoenicis TaxID=554083 RepID=A0A1R1LBT3_9MICC|nr:MSMEG_4193 family putative phosphomutase [Tersicoccus phoenicis]OMH24972.1 phosphoglycerate mutase [Tersicoccus phoenicis]